MFQGGAICCARVHGDGRISVDKLFTGLIVLDENESLPSDGLRETGVFIPGETGVIVNGSLLQRGQYGFKRAARPLTIPFIGRNVNPLGIVYILCYVDGALFTPFQFSTDSSLADSLVQSSLPEGDLAQLALPYKEVPAAADQALQERGRENQFNGTLIPFGLPPLYGRVDPDPLVHRGPVNPVRVAPGQLSKAEEMINELQCAELSAELYGEREPDEAMIEAQKNLNRVTEACSLQNRELMALGAQAMADDGPVEDSDVKIMERLAKETEAVVKLMRSAITRQDEIEKLKRELEKKKQRFNAKARKAPY